MTGLAVPSFVVITATDYMTVLPTGFLSIGSTPSPILSSTMASRSSTAGLGASPSSMATSTSMVTASFPTTTAIHTGIPPLPSHFNKPVSPKPKFNDTFAIIALVAVIFMAVLLCALIGYMIYLCCKGDCPKCKNMKDQVSKWERGELKRITMDMVKKREALSDGSSLSGSVLDLEKGSIDDFKDDIVQNSRAAALNSLEGTKKASFWHDVRGTFQTAKGMVKGEDKKNGLSPIHIRESKIDGDRFFTVEVGSPVPHQQTLSQPPQAHSEPGNDRLYEPPSPSTYSQPTEVSRQRAFCDHTEANMPQLTRTTRDSFQQPSTYTAYMRNSYQIPSWRQAQHHENFF